MAKKTISILLMVCMLLCSINFPVFAADGYTEEYLGDDFTRLTLTDQAFAANTAREFSVNIQNDGDYAVFLNNVNKTKTNFTVTFTKDGVTQTLCDGTTENSAYGYAYVRIGASTDVDSVSVPLTKGTWTMSVKSVAAITVGYIDIRSTTVLIDGSKQAIYPSDYNYHEGKIPSANYINGDMEKAGAKAAGYEYYADFGDTLRRGIHLSGNRTIAYELNVQTAGTYKIKLAGQFYLASASSSDKTLTTAMSVDGNESGSYSYTYTAGTSGRSATQELVYVVNLAAGVNTLTVAPASGGDLYIYTLTIESYDPDKENTYVLVDDGVINYMADARKAYVTDEYADYTTSIIENGYYEGIADKYDKSKPVSLTWDAIDGAESYTLLISPSEDFSKEVITISGITDTSYDVYNLKTDTVYNWKVQAGSVATEPAKFYTDDTVRFITVGGVKNVRDLGGWNGLNQGMAFRGSALDNAEDSSVVTVLTDEGRKVLHDDLGIKTDLDFRSTNLTESPIGSDVQFKKVTITAYQKAYTEIEKYKSVLETFADIDNYPIYFHCSGGADRTGTVAFLLECLCGVAEEDLSIDYELTSFAVSFGRRWRHDTTYYFYASLINQMKAYEGATMQEKAENYALNTLGLTRAQISNIQSALSGNGVTFEKANGLPVNRTARVPLENMGSHTVASVTLNGNAVNYTMDGNTVNMLLTESGTGAITFEDGNSLTFVANEASSYVSQSLGEGFTRFTINDKDFLAGDTWQFPVTITEDGDYTVFLQKETTEANNFAVTFKNESGEVVTLIGDADPSDGYKYNYVRVGSGAGESGVSAALTAGEWTMSVKAAANTTLSYIDLRRTDIPVSKNMLAIYPSDFNSYASIAADSDVNGEIGKVNVKASGYDYYADYDNDSLAAYYNGDRQIYVSPGKTVTYKLNVAEEGTYRINFNYAFNLAEKAAEDKTVTISAAAGGTTKTESYTYIAGKSGKAEPQTLTVEAALAAGEQTITVTTSDAGAYLQNLTISGYSIEQDLLAKTNYSGLGNGGTAAAGFSGTGYITWQFTPEYSGVYDISSKIGCTVDAYVSIYNAENSAVSDTNLIGTKNVKADGGYATTVWTSFGELQMLAGETYTITLKYATAVESGPYVSRIKATWLRGVSEEEKEVILETGLVKGTTVTSVAEGSQYGNSFAVNSSKYVDLDFVVPVDGEYEIFLKGCSTGGTTGTTVAINGKTFTGNFPDTTIYNEDGSVKTAGFNNTANKAEASFGTVSLEAGTYTLKVTVPGSNVLRLYGAILKKVGDFTEKTFDQTTRTDYKVSSDVNAQPTYMIPDSASAYAEHTITMSEGNYELSIKYGCQSQAGVVGVYVNGDYYGKFDAQINGKWNTNQTTLELTTVKLKEGENVIKFTAPDGKYYCYTTFTLKAIEEPFVTLYSGEAELGSEVTEITDGSMTVRALLPRDVKDKKVTMIFAIYENDAKLYKAATKEFIAEDASEVLIPIGDINLDEGATYTYKTFFWDGFENITPLF